MNKKSDKDFKKIINQNWHEIFDLIDKDIFEITENSYNEVVESKKNIFPIYKKIFSFTNYSIPSDIKVVIIGQDCYHGIYTDKETKISYPQATGLAFSVPMNCPIPPSLDNIYKNLLKYEHIVKMPKHGCLDFWAYQGVLLLNTSLSVEQSKPNSHQNIWFEFTDELIKIISNNIPKLVFVLWGSNAYEKMKIINNKESHKFIISSHPSPLSAFKPFKQYNSFMDTNHFGLINQNLLELKPETQPICWNIV